MKKKNNIIIGKNGIRNYDFEAVQKNKNVSHYDQHFGVWSEYVKGMFYKKQCLYCEKLFEGKRVDTAFCSQGCQKAHLRLRQKNIK